MKSLKEEAKSYQEELKEIRRQLHAHAEVGFDLPWTCQYVKTMLKQWGIQPIDCGKSGIVALIGNRPGKTFLLRADMDALPIQEQSDETFACTTGKMHACGHDFHTAMLLGAAKLLKKHEHEIAGTVKLMFQPSEETLEGAKMMIEHSVLENPVPDAAMMIHVITGIPVKSHTAIISKEEILTPAAAMFEIHIQGKGTHGSMPETGIDPLIAASHVLLAIESIRTREISSKENAMLTFGMMKAGDIANVIPDSVLIQGSLRAFNESCFQYMKKRIVEITQSVTKAYRCQSNVTFYSECPAFLNNLELAEQLIRYCEQLSDQKSIQASSVSGSSGSEDFSFVSQRIPTVMISLAAGHPDEGYLFPQHHPKVIFDESILWSGSLLYAGCAMSWLKENNTQKS